jgi:3-methyladenine DNA glycosylase AlkD
LKETADFQLLFDFIEPLMLDQERVVQQGLGWFLREAWKIRKNQTEVFLLKWKNEAPRLIYLYATEKMTATKKKRFKKEKK